MFGAYFRACEFFGEHLGDFMENKALNACLNEYSAVEARYIAALEQKGLVFESAQAGRAAREQCAELRAQLERAGAHIRNAGASISVGHLSPACVECTGENGSETFSTTFKCHRDCYFCFNRNQPDYQKFFDQGCPWEEGLRAAKQAHENLACIGLTGGEPLLNLQDSLAFLQRAAQTFPGAHMRMYTSGDLLDEAAARALRDAGLAEIRFSVKDDDTPEMQARVLEGMRVATQYIPSVMVEMPVVPGAGAHMQKLLRAFDEIGIDGINLLEFCFPFCNWPEFERRGLVLKNPPFDVMYDYGYSGGLAVAGSELEILQLMVWAQNEGLKLGLHYCSLDNKHRSEIRQKNERARGLNNILEFDTGDFFLKAAKAFGPDVAPVQAALEAAGVRDFMVDAQEQSITFALQHVPAVSAACAQAAAAPDIRTCYFVYEIDETDSGAYITDVALR
jgi:pyruvate formate-lyase activating enzyme-like uncharacterized protein